MRPDPTLGASPPRPSVRLITRLALAAVLSISLIPHTLSAQDVNDPARLAGIVRVQVRAQVEWDEQITSSAGGATSDQFRQALQQSFEGAITDADTAPSVVPGAPVTVACHVNTFYETGQILYALRVQTERPGTDGERVITWIKSWVGSFSTQQMHLMFGLGQQCAESFLDDWRSAN